MSDPFPGISPNLIPNPPGDMPEAPGARDAMASLSPFSEPQDFDSIVANLTLDRPLKLFVPKRELYPDWEFRVINSIPQELADAHNKGWREVTDPDLVTGFTDLVAGTDKKGAAFRPILVSRSKKIGDHIRNEHRKTLQSLYAGMDPKNKEFTSKYVDNVVDGKDGSKGQFSGAGFRIRAR